MSVYERLIVFLLVAYGTPLMSKWLFWRQNGVSAGNVDGVY